MTTNDAGFPEHPPTFATARPVDGNLPPRRAPQNRAQRQAKLRMVGQTMLAIMATALVAAGGLGSIRWNNALTRMIYPSPEQQYAGAALNLSSGLVFWIALIGVYLPAKWGIKLNIIGCLWYLVGTILLQALAGGKVAWSESVSNIVFWSGFPIIQIVCLVVGASTNPALVGEDDGQPAEP